MSELKEQATAMHHELSQIVALIESRHYASAFKSTDDYRQALQEFIEEVGRGAYGRAPEDAAFAEVICWLPVCLHKPDADQTVMLRIPDASEPVWPGYYDQDQWYSAEGIPVVPSHWAAMPAGEPA